MDHRSCRFSGYLVTHAVGKLTFHHFFKTAIISWCSLEFQLTTSPGEPPSLIFCQHFLLHPSFLPLGILGCHYVNVMSRSNTLLFKGALRRDVGLAFQRHLHIVGRKLLCTGLTELSLPYLLPGSRCPPYYRFFLSHQPHLMQL